MVTTQEAQENLRKAREILQTRRAEAQQVQSNLQEVKENLPQTTTQEALRSGSGLESRQLRRKVLDIQGQVGLKEKEVGAYIQGLSQYEKDNLQKYEGQINQAITEQKSYEKARDIFLDKSPYAVFRLKEADERTKYYYDQFLEGQQTAQAGFLKEMERLQAEFPEEKIVFDAKDMKITGVESGSFGQSLDIKAYNQKVEDYNKQFVNKQQSIFIPKQQFSTIYPLLPSPSYKIKQETYSPSLNLFGSVSPTGQQATSYFRPPTAYESIRFNLIQGTDTKLKKDTEKVVEAPLKFLRGEYEFQKEAEKKIQKQDSPQWIQNLPKGNLEEIPYSPQGFAPFGASMFSKASNFTGNILDKYTPYEKEKDLKIPQSTIETGILIGSLFAFDPLIRTGTASQQAKLKKQLSKNKFSDLFAEIESKVAEKGTRAEQIKVIERYKERFNLKQSDVDSLIKKLKEKNLIKDEEGIFRIVGPQPKPQETTIQLNIEGLPQTKGVSILGGGGASIRETEINPLAVRETILGGSKQKSKTSILSASSPMNALFDLTKSKEKIAQKNYSSSLSGLLSGSKQVEKLKESQKEKAKQGTALKTLLASLTLLKSSQVQKQKLRQPQKEGVSTKPKPKNKPKPPRKIFVPPRLPESYEEESKEKSKNLIEKFKAFYRKRGEDVLLGEFATKRKAEKKLKAFLEGDISASGIVTNLRGQKQKLNAFGMFRPSKVDPLRVVEKRRFRLSKPQEIFQIQRSKKKSSKKFKWL